MKRRKLNLITNKVDLKRDKEYEKWLNDFIKPPKEDELNKMEEETFLKAFPKFNHLGVNSLDYQPFFSEGA